MKPSLIPFHVSRFTFSGPSRPDTQPHAPRQRHVAGALTQKFTRNRTHRGPTKHPPPGTRAPGTAPRRGGGRSGPRGGEVGPQSILRALRRAVPASSPPWPPARDPPPPPSRCDPLSRAHRSRVLARSPPRPASCDRAQPRLTCAMQATQRSKSHPPAQEYRHVPATSRALQAPSHLIAPSPGP